MHLGSIYELVWFELHCALHDSSKRKLSKSEPAQSHPENVPCLDDFIGTGHEGSGVNLACKLLRKALSKRKKKNLTPLQKEVALAMTRALFFVVAPVDLLETTWPGQTTLQDTTTAKVHSNNIIIRVVLVATEL